MVGDATTLGWSVTLLYALAAILAAVAALRTADTSWHTFGFWVVAALALFVLGLNKQLDLQTLMRASLRCVALNDGWYYTEARPALKRAFVEAVALVALLSGMALLRWWRPSLPRIALALAGLAMVGGYVAGRTVLVAIADLDKLSAAQHQALAALEPLGLLLICLGAARARTASGAATGEAGPADATPAKAALAGPGNSPSCNDR